MDKRPLCFNDAQIKLLTQAVKAVPEERRTRFVADVAAHLSGAFTTYALQTAINIVLDRISTHFFCDSTSDAKELTDDKPNR